MSSSGDITNGAAADARPLLIYDGECGFCGYWARYWRGLTGEQVRYAPYQEVSAQYPGISVEEFRRAVQYIDPGRRASAAEASFLVLSHVRGKEIWLALYRGLPAFAALAELVYASIAAHRRPLYAISRLLWGRDFTPPRYDLACFLFMRGLALVFLSAFVSFAVQALGLIGSHGILPVAELVRLLDAQVGVERFLQMPMLFWLNAGDAAIRAVCWAGAGFSLLLFLNRLPRLSLLMIYVLYLSLLYGGQTFMTYQWDVYLLEAAVLALIMLFARTPGIWLFRWLLFRFMFMSGVVKLASGDPSWWDLSALSYHFFTQPLPTPLAWYAAQLPAGLLRFLTGIMFAVELVLPFLIFLPRRLRFVAGFGFIAFQSCIVLTGNYNWFNFQTLVLCLLLFDDAALRRVCGDALLRGALARRWVRRPAEGREPPPSGRAAGIIIGAIVCLIVFETLVQMDERFGGHPPAVLRVVERRMEPLHLASGYGLFAVMTTERNEIVIEGSADGVDWKEYEFRYKPGDVARRPPWNVPHQPRLDWQMWFAALDDPRRLPWFSRFLQKVLENDPAVMALLDKNPFPDKRPSYARARFYSYRFASPADKARGLWWTRRPLGLYFPEVRLRADSPR
jgi:predicted DCC family thiol-disulfide oxidoreductase YuxK